MAPLSDSQPLNVAVNVDEEKQQEFYSAYASSEFYADTRVSVYENGTDTLSVAREVVAMKAVQVEYFEPNCCRCFIIDFPLFELSV